MSQPRSSSPRDVVICGGGLSGILLARQLRRELPQLSVALIERTTRPLPDACHKVGESSVELGCQYFESLGLKEYLLEHHLVKLGLRFFPGGGTLPLHQRHEIGPCSEPVVKSYQMDRGRLENDLRGFLAEDGVEMIEGAKVTDIDLSTGGGMHRVAFENAAEGGAESGELTARWVVDATGRQALLRKRMKMTRGSPHTAHSGWFRVKGFVDINDMVPKTETEWFQRPCADERWRSTNHFMGPGYWAWLIPLSTGYHSVGLVITDEIHDASRIAGLEATMDFLREHEPHLAKLIEPFEVHDFLCLKGFSHNVSRSWSPDRWALVGEAGAFVDPLYSPGSDFIAAANHFTVEMIRTDLAGGDLHEKSNHLNVLYKSLFHGCADLFRRSAPIYGHPSAMSCKVFWDNLLYWSFTCHLIHQGLYKLPAAVYQPYGEIGTRFLELGNFVQGFLREWAMLAPEQQRPTFMGAPHFPSILVDAHVSVGERMTPEETMQMMKMRIAQGEEAVGEIVLRGLQTVGPELGEQLLEKSGFRQIGVKVSAHRLEGEAKVGKARRDHMTLVARDFERTLGKFEKHPEADRARELLLAMAPTS
ncbi:MAG: NAD(P)/FAD-dependent oxidoreductase [Planctomycetes bacterium]|nr:NAD(P)/FAD-dependent oxidoreductase [Planctomycetota bacterium]